MIFQYIFLGTTAFHRIIGKTPRAIENKSRHKQYFSRTKAFLKHNNQNKYKNRASLIPLES